MISSRARSGAAASALLVVLLAAGWYFASPLYTLNQMKSAAEANDGDALSRYVDYPSLREDLKAELMAQMLVQAEKDESGFGALGMALGSAMIGPLVDTMVSPAGLRAMFDAKRERERARTTPSPSRTAAPPPPAAPVQVPESPVIERRGLSEFVVRSKSPQQGAMLFTRHGLRWKLSGVDLPPAR